MAEATLTATWQPIQAPCDWHGLAPHTGCILTLPPRSRTCHHPTEQGIWEALRFASGGLAALSTSYKTRQPGCPNRPPVGGQKQGLLPWLLLQLFGALKSPWRIITNAEAHLQDAGVAAQGRLGKARAQHVEQLDHVVAVAQTGESQAAVGNGRFLWPG